MTSLDKCPVCNGQELMSKLDCLDHTTSQETFTIVSCGTCDFTFTNPRPLDKKLGDYYKSDMYISHTNNTKGLFNWMYQTVRNYAIGTKVSLLKSIHKKGTHLDIGCGTGEFLNACKLAGFTTKGIEPSELARKQAINNHGLNISSNTDLSQYRDKEFDSISMWHVLEHVPDLNETIRQFDRLLKPDGKIIIAVPNHKSWDAKFYKELWAAWDVPIHLWHFSKETIAKLFKNSNFSLEKTKPMIFDSFYVSILSEEFKTGKKNFIRGFVIGLISNLIGVISKRGHSSTIYVFKKDNKHF
jgi:2-polyprenyl-3-methyl-5-hydroxy-6-metoxy-1,4-benzoquinol methylase